MYTTCGIRSVHKDMFMFLLMFFLHIFSCLAGEYSAGRLIIRKVSKIKIWVVPRLVGRYCSYLLPKQNGGTTQIFIF